MKYNMIINIYDPKSNNRKEFNMVAEYYHNPDTYGNGYYLSITDKSICFDNYYDLRYNMDFDKNHKEKFLEDWANSYWSGKNGAYKLDYIEITKED